MSKLIAIIALGVGTILLNTVFASITVFIGLNLIANFSLSFPEVVGIGYVLAALRGTINLK